MVTGDTGPGQPGWPGVYSQMSEADPAQRWSEGVT